ncbi:hypothetical protein GCM10009682_06040 [Luedemannella flava]|uniref:Uncharacterized protein n=1 Tax=Luedemannella flava TaxID=349316 RepID=A0ABP4XQJ2_9ACTN
MPLLFAFALLAGCSDGEGTDVNCNLQECTVTFQRGVEASANVFGLEAKLVAVEDGMVTLDIGGNRITVPTDGDAEGVRVREVTKENVVVVIPHNIAG